MMFLPGFPRLTFKWPYATIGTPPFTMGFNFGESTSSGDLADVVSDVATWWAAQTTLLGYLTQELGPLYLEAVGEYAGLVVVEESAALAAPTGSPVDLPGVSVRLLLEGNRPRGGRKGCMYLPGLEGAGADETGTLNGTYKSNIDAAFTAMLTAVEASFAGAGIYTLHNVDGTPSQNVITDISVANTVSWLQRRYR